MTTTEYKPSLFWPKVAKTDNCWEWTACKTRGGYGTFSAKRGGRWAMVPAHRIAYEELVGPVPEGMFLDHTCHNTGCVNPGHLRIVTNKQNQENVTGAKRTSKSGVRGVVWNPRENKWRVVVTHRGQRHWRTATTLEEAKTLAQNLRNELFTHNDTDRTAAK